MFVKKYQFKGRVKYFGELTAEQKFIDLDMHDGRNLTISFYKDKNYM